MPKSLLSLLTVLLFSTFILALPAALPFDVYDHQQDYITEPILRGLQHLLSRDKRFDLSAIIIDYKLESVTIGTEIYSARKLNIKAVP